MAKNLTENFNLDKPLPTPPPSLPHMPAIASAHPLPLPHTTGMSKSDENEEAVA